MMDLEEEMEEWPFRIGGGGGGGPAGVRVEEDDETEEEEEERGGGGLPTRLRDSDTAELWPRYGGGGGGASRLPLRDTEGGTWGAVLRPGGSLAGGGGLLACWEDADGDGEGGGGGAWLRPWLPPPDVCFLCRELCLCGSSGAPAPSTLDAPLETLPDACGLYGGGGGGAEPTPNFHRIIYEGVTVERVESAYITKTFPNHYSLVTGLYAETHGIVANEMYDPALNRSFSMETDSIYESRWWEEAVPLWVTIQKAGGRSGAAMWPGSDVKIHGMFPNKYLPYNASVSFEARVERIIEWFSAPKDAAVDFGVLYWEEPDESGHNLGPQNSLMDVVIAGIDEKLGFLMNELKKAGLYEKVNLIVTSDHGMAQLSPDKIIELDEYVSRDLYTWVDKSPVVGILPKEGKFDEVYSKLADANPNMMVYKKEDIPEHFHYQHNIRIMPILIESKEGWTVVQNRTAPFMLGNHGYDNTLRSMQPVFVARGPAIRQNYVKTSMRSVDLYPLMCHILAIPPLPNNGSLSNVQDLLSLEPTPSTAPSIPPRANGYSYAPVVGSFIGVVMVLGFLMVYIRQVTLKQLPSLKHRSREMSQPLLQEDLHL